MLSEQRITLLLPGFNSSHASFRFSHEDSRQPWQSQLAKFLGLLTADGKRLPFAALSGVDINNGLVRADPISLKADRDTAKLVPAEQLALSDSEADELLAVLNAFVEQDGLRFFRKDTSRWYLSGMSAEALESYPPSFLADRNASAFLPDGDAAANWRRLLTEVQMLLHMQPVNELREQRGLLPVNSVWFWGGAALPEAQEQNDKVLLIADDDEAQALARHMGVACEPLSRMFSLSESMPAAEHIVVLDSSLVSAWLAADADKIENSVSRICEQWLSPLAHQVGQGTIAHVQVLTEDGLQGVCDLQSIATLSPARQTSGFLSLMKKLIPW